MFATLPLWPTAYLFVLGLSFYYFVLAGSRTFEVNPGDETPSGIAQFSFLITGTLGTLFLNFRKPLPLSNAIASAALLFVALSIYEWARRTVRDRRFHLAWTGDVPEALCDEGPYRHIRHPFYSSYILVFLAAAVAYPGPISLAILVFNAGLFVHAAVTDENSLANSELAPDYAAYKTRTGMFLPRVGVHKSWGPQ